MADSKGNDPKPTESKTGPVKPPVLDLKARETAPGKPEARTPTPPEGRPATATPVDAKPADTKPVDTKPAAAADAKPAPAKEPPARAKPIEPAPASRRGFAFGAAIVGGLLGLGAAYGLAWYGLWPASPAPTAAAADPRLAQFATAIPELETVTQTTQSELATLNQRIGALESAEPAAQAATTAAAEPVDLGTVEGDIAALSARLDTLAAAPAPTLDTSAVDSLRTELAALATRLDEVSARLGTTEAGLRTIETTVTETTATLAEQPTDIGAVLQLPLILSGFETAFASGRPYPTELGALRAALPQAAIPTAIANKAETGLTRPDIIASRFATVLPAMLAGRPGNPDAQWQDGALDWFRSAIALRPSGEIEGDTPEAVMTQLESAVARRDFISAEALLAALPAPMLAAGEDVPALIAEQAEAARFLDSLRASALAGEVTP